MTETNDSRNWWNQTILLLREYTTFGLHSLYKFYSVYTAFLNVLLIKYRKILFSSISCFVHSIKNSACAVWQCVNAGMYASIDLKVLPLIRGSFKLIVRLDMISALTSVLTGVMDKGQIHSKCMWEGWDSR